MKKEDPSWLPWVKPRLTDQQIRRLEKYSRYLAGIVLSESRRYNEAVKKINRELLNALQTRLRNDAVAWRNGNRLDAPIDADGSQERIRLLDEFVQEVADGKTPVPAGGEKAAATAGLSDQELEICRATGVAPVQLALVKSDRLDKERAEQEEHAASTRAARAGGMTADEIAICRACGTSHADYIAARAARLDRERAERG